MAVASISATVAVPPNTSYPVLVVFEPIYVRGGDIKEPYRLRTGTTFHIVDSTVHPRPMNSSVWYEDRAEPLCRSFVGYSRRRGETYDAMDRRRDRICKTCWKITESRAKTRGLR